MNIPKELHSGEVSSVNKRERIELAKNELRFEVVNNGAGIFAMHIYPRQNGMNFHPIMHEKMKTAINNAVISRVHVGDKLGPDFKVEFLQMMNSYCIMFANIYNILWQDLFSLIAKDIADSFRFSDFLRR